jgi:serine/threonine protein kinase
MTGEKFVRQLPHFSKKNFRKVFDECNDEDTLKFIEKLLVLEPSERMNASEALNHPYLQKHQKCGTTDNLFIKLEEILNFDEENVIEMIRQNVEILE